MIRLTIAFLIVGAMGIGRIGVRLFGRWGILDKPGPDVPKRNAVPTLQGLIAIVSFFLLVYLFYPGYLDRSIDEPFFGLLVGGVVLAVVSFVDELGRIYDRAYRVGPIVRLIVQIWVALVAYLVSWVGIDSFVMPGGVLVEFGPLSQIVLTVAWYLIFINAINFFDGIYGLASGISAIGFLTIFLLIDLIVLNFYPEMSGERQFLLEWVKWYALVLGVVAWVATSIEFAPHGLLRDVGTTFFGFALAYLALLWGAKIGMMVVVLALPLFDAVWVVIDRLHRNKNPFRWDYTHLHYRLLALGWNRNEIRVFIRWWSVFLVVLMLLQWGDRLGKVIIFVLMAMIFFGVNRYLFRYKWLPHEYRVSNQTE